MLCPPTTAPARQTQHACHEDCTAALHTSIHSRRPPARRQRTELTVPDTALWNANDRGDEAGYGSQSCRPRRGCRISRGDVQQVHHLCDGEMDRYVIARVYVCSLEHALKSAISCLVIQELGERCRARALFGLRSIIVVTRALTFSNCTSFSTLAAAKC